MYDTVIVTGSLAYDQILNLPGTFSSYILPEKIHQINISFVTERHQKRLGGTGGNQAYSLHLLSEQPILYATAGNDFNEYRRFLEKTSIDIRYIKIIPHEKTALGVAITDKKDNQIWGFSKGAMAYSKNLSLLPLIKKLKKSHKTPFVIIAPNEPMAIARYIDECITENIDFSFDPAFYIPILSKNILKKGLQHARIIFGNDYEIALMKKKLNNIKNLSLQKKQFLVTTLAHKGSLVQKGDKTYPIAPAKTTRVIDPTGAGDAYRAGFIVGYIKGKHPAECGKIGSVAAVYAIEHYGTMEHTYTLDKFKKRVYKNYNVMLP